MNRSQGVEIKRPASGRLSKGDNKLQGNPEMAHEPLEGSDGRLHSIAQIEALTAEVLRLTAENIKLTNKL